MAMGLFTRQTKTMNDLIYVGVMLAFFAASAAYVRLCQKL
jgi:hypothetical protein